MQKTEQAPATQDQDAMHVEKQPQKARWVILRGIRYCKAVRLTYTHHIPAQEEYSHHGEAVVQVQL